MHTLESLGPALARGGSADIFLWGTDAVVKLFRPGCPLVLVEHEAARARAAHQAGVRTPAVLDVVTLASRFGIVFEGIDGPSLLDVLCATPAETMRHAQTFAGLHADLHARHAPGLPDRRRSLYAAITQAAMPENHRAAALAELEGLPTGPSLCHGDFHPQNIILTAAGPQIIDWFDAAQGHPLADVARTVYLLRFAALPPHVDGTARVRIEAVRAAFCEHYLQHYASLRPLPWDQLDRWLLVIAAARSVENLAGAEQAVVQKVLEKLIAER